MRTDLALIVFVKYPEPGKVKTRLAKFVGFERAAELYREFAAMTFRNGESLAHAARFAFFTPAEKEAELRTMFPGEWHWLEQHTSSNLGVRIHHAILSVRAQGYQRVLTIGTDSPNLPLAYLEQAAAALHTHDLVLGPAEDGGYYLIGVKAAPLALFEGIAWSTEKVFAQTLERAEALKFTTHTLPMWYDVDDLATLEKFNTARLAAETLACVREV